MHTIDHEACLSLLCKLVPLLPQVNSSTFWNLLDEGIDVQALHVWFGIHIRTRELSSLTRTYAARSYLFLLRMGGFHYYFFDPQTFQTIVTLLRELLLSTTVEMKCKQYEHEVISLCDDITKLLSSNKFRIDLLDHIVQEVCMAMCTTKWYGVLYCIILFLCIPGTKHALFISSVFH